MKVILLAPLPPPSGGIASWAKRMQTTELKNDWLVEIVDEKVIGGRDIFGNNTGKSLKVEAKRCFNIWHKLNVCLKDQNAKIVHSSIPAGFTGMLREVICALITKLHGRKFIIHFRCTIPNMVKDNKTLFVFKRLVSLSDAVIVLNIRSQDFVKKYFKNKEIKLIPNFVSLDETDCIQSDRDTGINVVYIGGVIQEKGCADIIKCAEKTPSINYRLIGAVGDDMKNIALPSNVIFCGETDKNGVQKELEKADIFMFVSLFHGEGFSNALAEAMAKKLPCVVSDWAANADMIEDKGGYVVQVHDVDAMVHAVSELAENECLRKQMGTWNQNKVKQFYSQRCVTDQYVDLYESLVN